MQKKSFYHCAKCGNLTNLGIKLDKERRLVVCSQQCLHKVQIKEYFPDANLTTTFLSRPEFGHQGWLILHSISIDYPDNPSDKDIRDMYNFFYGFCNMYPCGLCRRHLVKMVKNHPPDFSSRNKFIYWIWERHNQVSKRLGKPQYPFLHQSVPLDKISNDVSHLFESGIEGNLTKDRISKERLGQATWMFLHSMAASYQYPEDVKQEHISWTKRFYTGLCNVYPDKQSSEELRLEVYDNVDFDAILKDRRLYMAWLCRFHNRINAKLGKPVYSAKQIKTKLEEYRCDHEHL